MLFLLRKADQFALAGISHCNLHPIYGIRYCAADATTIIVNTLRRCSKIQSPPIRTDNTVTKQLQNQYKAQRHALELSYITITFTLLAINPND